MSPDPFDKLAQRITEEWRQTIQDEIRKYKRTECKNGGELSWREAWDEWTEEHRQEFGQLLKQPVTIPEEAMPESSRQMSR